MKHLFVLLSTAAVTCLLTSAAMAQPIKIDVCHVPPGNPENVHAITVSENAVPAHRAHGDIACCPGETCAAGGICTGPAGCFACSCDETCENLCPVPNVPCGPIDCCGDEICVQDGVCQSGNNCFTCSCGATCEPTPCP